MSPTSAARNLACAGPVEVLVPPEPDLAHLGGNVQGGDFRTYTPPVWAFLMGMAAPALERDQLLHVLDLGCGEGDAALWFQRHGCVTLATDGWSRNVEAARALGVHAVQHDFHVGSTGVPFVPRGDTRYPRISWCCEVLEHIYAARADAVVATLCAPGTVVVGITAAPPGQDGHHHVNCQPPEYWDKKFVAHGFVPNVQATTYSRILLDACAVSAGIEPTLYYWRRSGRIYSRASTGEV